jgi:3-hydroxyisobutyrate dehydrogenase-like beta-hydroxyacid dehydrogenase
MAKLGFLGLGIMGWPMARHLVEAGHEVAVWSHNTGKARKFAETHQAAFCSKPEDVARQSECSFLCVGDTAMSREVILGEEGLSRGATPGSVIVDCSTIAPSVSVNIATLLAPQGVALLDAPCTGSKAGAEGGTLTFMVGGNKAIFDRVTPYFEAMGKSLNYCGAQGMGLRAKLTQNLILGNLLQAFNEGLVLSTKAGLDPELMLDILNNSAARSGLVSAKAPAVFRRDFQTNFSVKWLAKDMSLMIDAAAELGVPVPVTTSSRRQLEAAIVMGFGDDDICGSIRVLEEQAGCQVSSRPKAVQQ